MKYVLIALMTVFAGQAFAQDKANANMFCQASSEFGGSTMAISDSEGYFIYTQGSEYFSPDVMTQVEGAANTFVHELGDDCSNQITGFARITLNFFAGASLLTTSWCDDDGWAGETSQILHCGQIGVTSLYQLEKDFYNKTMPLDIWTQWDTLALLDVETKDAVRILKKNNFSLEKVTKIETQNSPEIFYVYTKTSYSDPACEGNFETETLDCEMQ